MKYKNKLTFQKEMSFWDFYNANAENVEGIISHACKKHQHIIDYNDMHAALLIRLQRSNILKDYDETKTALNTYLTNRVAGYALHIVTAYLKHITYKKGSTKIVQEESVVKGLFSSRKITKHNSNKKRPLTEDEKRIIRNEFIAVNGKIAEDVCVEIKLKLDSSVSIFQITGYITRLHRQAKDILPGNVLKEYYDFIESHRKHWATYKSSKYIAMRNPVEPISYYNQMRVEGLNNVNSEEESLDTPFTEKLFENSEEEIDLNIDVQDLLNQLKQSKNLNKNHHSILNLVINGYDFRTIADLFSETLKSKISIDYIRKLWQDVLTEAKRVLRPVLI